MIATLRKLPAPVWALAMIFGVGGAMCLFAAAFPLSPTAPVGLARVIGCMGLALAAAIVAAGRRLSTRALQGATIVATLMSSVLVAACTTDYGAALDSFIYLWIAIYAGQFFEPRAVRVQSAVIVVASGVALQLTGVRGMVTVWVLIAGSSVLASEALARVNSRLRRQLTTDPLTGLLNRAGFADASERVRALAEREEKPVSIALIDLDEFKRVNDLQGHAAGDELLADLGRAWRAELRGSEVLGRFNGDEFALVMAGAAPNGAEEALRRLRTVSSTGWSVGLVEWERGEPLERAMARADAELYRAKRARRACEDVDPWAPATTSASTTTSEHAVA